jgi:hypothetical protein
MARRHKSTREIKKQNESLGSNAFKKSVAESRSKFSSNTVAKTIARSKGNDIGISNVKRPSIASSRITGLLKQLRINKSKIRGR